MSTKKAQIEKKYDPRQAFRDGVHAGAEYYALAMSHSTQRSQNSILARLRDGAKEINESFDICREFNQKRQKDWRIGHFTTPKSEESPYGFPCKIGLAKFHVLDIHPSGTGGVESADGVLELAAWWHSGGSSMTRDPRTYYVPADEWAVA